MCTADGVEKKDNEMESGIESDQEPDDTSSLNDVTRAAAAAAAIATRQTSSVDELIQLLMMRAPPSTTSASVDTDEFNELARLVNAPPPSSPAHTARWQHCPTDINSYSQLVIPPPPSSQLNDADVELFLAKVSACNGVVASVNGLSDGTAAAKRYIGRQVCERTTHCGPALTDIVHFVNDNSDTQSHHRCATAINVPTTSDSTRHPASDRQTSSTSDCRRLTSNDQVSQSSGVSKDNDALKTASTQTLAAESLPLDSSSRTSSEILPCTAGHATTLTRRRAPAPPPRTSSVQNSAAPSCRSEQLARRALPRIVGHEHRLSPLTTAPSLGRSAMIRPTTLRSSFSANNERSAMITVSAASPNCSSRRTQSLTQPYSTSSHRATRPSLLSVIGSRLRSYWSPSTRRRQGRPASATGRRDDYQPPQLNMPCQDDYDVGGLLTDDDDDETMINMGRTTGQLHTSPTTSSFSSFTGQ